MNTTNVSDGHGGILPLVCRYPLRAFVPARSITLGAVADPLVRPPTREGAQTLVLRQKNPVGASPRSRPEDLKTTDRYPSGPGRKVIGLAGLVGGILSVLGLLSLTASTARGEPRAAEAELTLPRWTAAEHVIFQRIAKPSSSNAPRGNGVQHPLTNGAD